jgi:hypothetical protein
MEIYKLVTTKAIVSSLSQQTPILADTPVKHTGKEKQKQMHFPNARALAVLLALVNNVHCSSSSPAISSPIHLDQRPGRWRPRRRPSGQPTNSAGRTPSKHKMSPASTNFAGRRQRRLPRQLRRSPAPTGSAAPPPPRSPQANPPPPPCRGRHQDRPQIAAVSRPVPSAQRGLVHLHHRNRSLVQRHGRGNAQPDTTPSPLLPQ